MFDRLVTLLLIVTLRPLFHAYMLVRDIQERREHQPPKESGLQPIES